MKKYLFFLLKRYRKFVLIGFVFVIWMFFFDDRNVFVQKKLSSQIVHLEEEYDDYEAKLERAKSEFQAMKKHPEKYAREKYFMHKPTEEVFIYRPK
jgi:cell division protein FtsB